MKLTTKKQDLSKALTQAAGIVERKNTIPILAHIKITASDGKLTIEATDLDITFKTSIEADVQEEGATTVDAHLFAGIVKKLSSDIELTADASTLTVQSGRSKFSLASLDADSFPVIANDEYGFNVDIDALELRRLLTKSSFAMSLDETRYYLNGVYLHSDNGVMRSVATDGSRMAVVTSDVVAEFEGVIIPRKTVIELGKVLDIGDVSLSISETKIQAVAGPVTITSKVIDGAFPDYKRIIPSNTPNVMTVDAGEFKAATERVSLVSQEKARTVRLDVSDGSCELNVHGGHNDATEELAITLEGDPVSIGFNSKFLADVMQQCVGDNVTMSFNGMVDPAVIRPSEDDGFMVVVMPMRV